jgi:hypothetical protein
VADDYGVSPVFTGKKTKAGRPLWQTPSGKLYSERTMTIPLDYGKDKKPLPNTRWVNVPTVFDAGQVIDNEDFLLKFYSANKFKDPITGEKLKFFKSLDAAVSAAKERSAGLLD